MSRFLMGNLKNAIYHGYSRNPHCTRVYKLNSALIVSVCTRKCKNNFKAIFFISGTVIFLRVKRFNVSRVDGSRFRVDAVD